MVYVVTADNIAEAWIKAVCMVYKHGEMRETEYNNNALTLPEPLVIHVNRPFMEPRTCDKYSDFKSKGIEKYRRDFLTVADTGHTYTYSNRLMDYPMWDEEGFTIDGHGDGFNQIQTIINGLLLSPISRRQIAHTWVPVKDAFMEHCPCLQDVHYFIDDHTLNCVAHFRSNDILDAWLANANGLDELQNYIGKNIFAQNKTIVGGTGYLETYSMFAHIYEERLDLAKRIVAETHWGKCYEGRI